MNLHQQAAARRLAIQGRNGRRVSSGLTPCPGCPPVNGQPRTWIKPQPAPVETPEKKGDAPVFPSGEGERATTVHTEQDSTTARRDIQEGSNLVLPEMESPAQPQLEPSPSSTPASPTPASPTPTPTPSTPLLLRKRHGRQPNWAVGITAVPERFDDLTAGHLGELRKGGFDPDRMFADGLKGFDAWRIEERFGVPVTNRWPRISVFGNWCLGLGETA